MKLGIALSGGGIRGIAHAGVLQALEENGIKPDIIGGASCGSMIATMYGMGYSPYHIYILFKRYARTIAKSNDISILSKIKKCLCSKNVINGVNSGEKIEVIYNMMAKRRNITNINQIKMRIVIPAVDMITSKEVVFTNHIPERKNNNKDYINDIDVGKAIRASSSFPVYFSPCKFNEYLFMDGAALNNVPADEVKAQGADCVIAVKFNADDVQENSDIMDIAMKSIDIMGTKISEDNLKMSDFVLDVYTDKVGLLDFEKLDKCYEYGYKATIDNLDNIKKLLL